MTSSPDTYAVPTAFRPVADAQRAPRIAPARLDTVLRGNALLDDLEADARVVDPRLARVVEAAAARAREDARAEGFALGYREGRAALEHEMQREIEQIRLDTEELLAQRLENLRVAAIALAAAAADLEQRVVPSYADAGDDLGPAVMALVEALLGRELVSDRPAVLDAIRRAVSLAPSGAPLVLHLHPDDAATLTSGEIDLPATLQRAVEIVPDVDVERGGAVCDSGARRIDAQLSTALDRLREALLP